MSESKFSVLIIDDDPVYRNLLRAILKEKLTVFAAESPSVGFKILKTEPIDIVISDFKLPEMDGLKVLEYIRDEYPRVEVIMISSSGTMDTVIGALRKGAADYLKKPFSAPEIWLAMERTKRFMELDSDLKQAKKITVY